MGAIQTGFLVDFSTKFAQEMAGEYQWFGGQAKANTARLMSHQSGRRGDIYHPSERFELGDLATTINGHRVVIEFESKQVPIQNLLKYWPYLRGELSTKPDMPVVICHFSDWWSYGVNRDLWEWTLEQMQKDRACLQPIRGVQLDHGGANLTQRNQSITDAVEWIRKSCAV